MDDETVLSHIILYTLKMFIVKTLIAAQFTLVFFYADYLELPSTKVHSVAFICSTHTNFV